MVVEPKIREVYKEIQRQLFYMIPEKWDKVYLYSSILEPLNNIEKGELYFYYIPKGLLKKNPVNVYEIPSRFSIDDNEYLKLVDRLYAQIKKLQQVCSYIDKKKWSSIILSIGDFKFTVEYNYDDVHSYNSYERHLIFRYKYLQYPITSFSKEQKKIIFNYLYNKKFKQQKNKIYSEPIYQLPFTTIDIGSKNGNIQYIKEDDARLIEESKEIKSQILKLGI